jgi:hypothetical protein
LRAVQGLNLAFLIHAKHQGMIGRIEVKPSNVTHFLNKERVGGELETACTMGLDGKGPKQTVHGRFGDAARRRSAARCPRHGAISRIALVCVHVAEHNALIESIGGLQKRPHFDLGFEIEIVTCKRSDHSSDEFVVARNVLPKRTSVSQSGTEPGEVAQWSHH